jgi:hypothetical protein
MRITDFVEVFGEKLTCSACSSWVVCDAGSAPVGAHDDTLMSKHVDFVTLAKMSK